MLDLTNKTALITGGGSGIGLGIAQALAEAGCRVMIAGRNLSKLEEAAATVAEPNRPLVKACDITDREEVTELIAHAESAFGHIDILANSAGLNVAKRKMCELSPEDFDRIMAVNCTGLFNVLQAVLPGMRQRQDGLIFSVSSIAGKRALPLAGPAYATSKFGATALG
ncbi:MAG: SDR family oxidoreductase, partial [Verrucomicrobiota bacterium]